MFPSLKKQVNQWNQLISNSSEEDFDVVDWITSAARLIKKHGNSREKRLQILSQIISFYNEKLNDDQRVMVLVYLFGKSVDRL